jgi:hypothetical protein
MAAIGIGTAVVGAGASIYGASRAGKGGGPAPAPVDIFKRGPKGGKSIAEKQLAGTVGYYGSALPQFLDLNKQYSPEFIKQGFEFGQQGVTGFQGLRDLAAGGEADAMARLRESELGTMTDQAGMTRGLMESLSPEQAAQVKNMQDLAGQAAGAEGAYAGRMGEALGTYGIRPQTFNPTIQAAEQDAAMANQMAQEAYARRGTLSSQEQRSAQQTAREAAQSAGRLGGNAAIAAEIQNRESALAGRRAQASQAGQQAFDQRQNLANLRFQEQQALFNQGITGATTTADMQQAGLNQIQDIEKMRAGLRNDAGAAATNAYNAAGGFYTTPGLNLLNQTPQSYTAGTNMANIGLNFGNTMGANLDYNLPLNLAREMGGATNQQNSANYAINAQNEANKAAMWSNIGSSMMGAGMNMGGGGFSTPGTMTAANTGAYIGNYGRSAMGLPLRAYTI